MHQLGFSVLNRGNLLEAMDTAAMFRSYTQDPNARSLGGLLYHFDLMGWHLHNAGNDAVYTVWAMLAICVKEAEERGTSDAKQRREENAAKQTETAIEQAKERAKENAEGFTSPEGEDGGVAISPSAGDAETNGGGKKPVYGPPKPPEGFTGLYTMGEAPLDV